MHTHPSRSTLVLMKTTCHPPALFRQMPPQMPQWSWILLLSPLPLSPLPPLLSHHRMFCRHRVLWALLMDRWVMGWIPKWTQPHDLLLTFFCTFYSWTIFFVHPNNFSFFPLCKSHTYLCHLSTGMSCMHSLNI